MPREGVHLRAAYEIHSKLTGKNSDVDEMLQREQTLYALGSAFPDAFYFYTPLFKDERGDIADRIHGTEGRSTNTPILEMAKHSKDPQTFAFLAGMLTHYALDQEMHPMIYYLTGRYYDDNKVRQTDSRLHHRRLEAQMDRDLSTYRGAPVSEASQLYGVDGLAAFENRFEVTRKQIVGAMKAELFVTNLSFKPRAYRSLMWFHNHKMKIGGEEFQGSFIPGAPEEVFIGSDPISYKNPVSGEEFERSFDEMLSRGVYNGEKMIKALYHYMFESKDVERFETIVPGLALDSGLFREGVDRMKFFAPEVAERQKDM